MSQSSYAYTNNAVYASSVNNFVNNTGQTGLFNTYDMQTGNLLAGSTWVADGQGNRVLQSLSNGSNQTWQAGSALTDGIKIPRTVASQLFNGYLGEALAAATVSLPQRAYLQLTDASGSVTGSQTFTQSAPDANTRVIRNAAGQITSDGTVTTSLSNNRLSAVVDTQLGGHNVRVLYSEDSHGDLVASKLVSYDGKTPANATGFLGALTTQKISPWDLAANHPGEAPAALGDASGNPIEPTPENLLKANDPAKPGTGDTLQNSLTTITDVLTLLNAIKNGQPMPALASGLRLANDIINQHGQTSTNLNGASDIANAINSVLNLHDALKNGDAIGAITAGASATGYAVKAYEHFLNSSHSTELGSFLNGSKIYDASGKLASSTPGAIAYLNIVNSLIHGDAIGAAINTIALIPGAAPFALAFNIVRSIFGLFGGKSIPPAWGSGQFTWDQDGKVSYIAQGKNSGKESVSAVLSGLLTAMNKLIEDQNAADAAKGANNPLGIIPSRLSSLTYSYKKGGYQFSNIDPITGQDAHPDLVYDPNGNPINATPGTPEAYQSLLEAMLRAAIKRGAIAAQWEVDTARLQTQNNLTHAGLTEEERAARNGNINPNPQHKNADGTLQTTQTARVIGLDLDGGGIRAVSKDQSGIAFDIDDSGYLKNTGWIAPGDGMLTLDRDLSKGIERGSELFNNNRIALSQRGLKGLAWLDANGDGLIDSRDPVFTQLKVWQDSNQNGVMEEIAATFQSRLYVEPVWPTPATSSQTRPSKKAFAANFWKARARVQAPMPTLQHNPDLTIYTLICKGTYHVQQYCQP